jgi:hypothetical protein
MKINFFLTFIEIKFFDQQQFHGPMYLIYIKTSSNDAHVMSNEIEPLKIELRREGANS